MVGMPKYLSEDGSAFLARNFYPNLNASCCLYSHVRKPWILVSSRISGIWRFEFFFSSFRARTWNWNDAALTFLKDRVRAFLSEGKKVIIFFEIPSAQKATNPYGIEHISIGPFWYISPLIGEWKYFRRVSSTIMSASTHNNILGVTLSGDFGDVCTLSDLRPNRSWAIPHNCLIIVSAHNIDRAEAAAAIPSLAMSWPSLQFGSIRGQHLQAVSYVLS